nr:hypothetical protein [uncultured Marvinbryantia sp.]
MPRITVQLPFDSRGGFEYYYLPPADKYTFQMTILALTEKYAFWMMILALAEKYTFRMMILAPEDAENTGSYGQWRRSIQALAFYVKLTYSRYDCRSLQE